MHLLFDVLFINSDGVVVTCKQVIRGIFTSIYVELWEYKYSLCIFTQFLSDWDLWNRTIIMHWLIYVSVLCIRPLVVERWPSSLASQLHNFGMLGSMLCHVNSIYRDTLNVQPMNWECWVHWPEDCMSALCWLLDTQQLSSWLHQAQWCCNWTSNLVNLSVRTALPRYS